MNGFGEKIKELREEKGLSQMNLSKQIDITQSAIARYELELTEPRASDIKKICEFFNVTSDYLIGLDNSYTPLKKNSIKFNIQGEIEK